MRPAQRTKQAIIERAGERCEYCLSPMRYSPDPFAAEHIIPSAKGGKDDASNLALSCQGCNNAKFTSIEAFDPITEDYVPLYHPRQHTWRDHFVWSEDATLIVGLTPTGRATIIKLRLNREGVVNFRRALIALGVHPPGQ